MNLEHSQSPENTLQEKFDLLMSRESQEMNQNSLKQELNVIHLATSHMGGAGIAARELNRKLGTKGVNSKIVFLDRKQLATQSNEIKLDRNFWTKILSYLISRINLSLSGTSYFSLLNRSSVDKFFLQELSSKSHTIIHIHNYYNLISIEQIRYLLSLNCKIALTLHDERFLSGGCHSTIDCTQFEIGCLKCPNKKFGVSRIASSNVIREKIPLNIGSNLKIFAPSRWILDEARRSFLRKDFESVLIPNCLYSRITSKAKAIGDVVKVGIASVDPYSKLKGGKLLKELEELIKSKEHSPLRLIYMADFNTRAKNDFWSEIDVLFVPSLHDNSPNVIHEAKSRGIPIVASKVGGISEMLSPDVDKLFNPRLISPHEIFALIGEFTNTEIDVKSIIKMQEDFEEYLGDPVEKHIVQYLDLLSRFE